jgi:hypothetical protein
MIILQELKRMVEIMAVFGMSYIKACATLGDLQVKTIIDCSLFTSIAVLVTTNS